MKRREFISLLGGVAAAWPLATRSQQADGMRRVGVLASAAEGDLDMQARVAGFRQGLERSGWSNARIDVRFTVGKADLFQVLAKDPVFVTARCDLRTRDSGRRRAAAGEPHDSDRVRL